jgi:hypothetical protein
MSLGQHAVQMALLLLVLGGPVPLAIAAVWVLERQRERAGAAESVLLLLVVWSVLQACASLSLGAAGAFKPGPVFAFEAVMLVMGLALMLRARASSAESVPEQHSPTRPMKAAEALIVGSVCALGAALLWQISTQPITEHDSLAYHLPSMARWYQSGSFTMLPQFPLFKHYPYSWEALCTLCLMPFREDFLVALPNVVVWAIFGLACYRLGRLVGAGTAAAGAGAVLALSAPIVVRHTNTMHIDLPLAAFFLAALCFAALRWREPSPAWLGVGVASACMVAAVKTSGLIYVAVAFLVLCFSAARRRQKGPAPSAVLVAGLGGAAGVFVGCFWYARNWIETGNPLGPVRVAIGSLTLPGVYDLGHFRATSLARVFEFWSPADWDILFGAAWVQFAWPLVALLLLSLPCLAALFVPRASTYRRGALTAIALAVATFALYILTPYSGDNGIHRGLLHPSIGPQMRFGFAFLGAVAVLSALGATVARVPPIALAAVAAGAVAHRLAALGVPYWFILLPAIWLGVWAAQRPLLSHLDGRAKQGLSAAALAAGAIALSLAAFSARAQRDRARSSAYGPVYGYVSTQIGPNETIGYAYCGESYLLYGKHLDRRLIYIPFTTHDSARWRSFIREHNIDVISIGPIEKHTVAVETVDWIKNGGLPAELVFARDLARRPFLYRVRAAERDR